MRLKASMVWCACWSLLCLSCQDDPPAPAPSVPAPDTMVVDTAEMDVPDEGPVGDAETPMEANVGPDPIAQCTALAGRVAACTTPECVMEATQSEDYPPAVRDAFRALQGCYRRCPQDDARINDNCETGECAALAAACLGPNNASCEVNFDCRGLVDNCLQSDRCARDGDCAACARCANYLDQDAARTLRTCLANPQGDETCAFERFGCDRRLDPRCCEGQGSDDPEQREAICICLCRWAGECFRGEPCQAPENHPYERVGNWIDDELIADCQRECREDPDDRENIIRVGCLFNNCGQIVTLGQEFVSEVDLCGPQSSLCGGSLDVCFECLTDEDCSAVEERPYCSGVRFAANELRRTNCFACDPLRPLETCQEAVPGGFYDVKVCKLEGQAYRCQACEPGDCGDLVCSPSGLCECTEDTQCGGLRCVAGRCECDDAHPCGQRSPICDPETRGCRECRAGSQECGTDPQGATIPCHYGRCGIEGR